MLNVGSAHVGEFGSAEAIAQAKGELVESLQADGVVVLNADDPLVGADGLPYDGPRPHVRRAGDVASATCDAR